LFTETETSCYLVDVIWTDIDQTGTSSLGELLKTQKPIYSLLLILQVQIAIHQKYNSNRYGMILYHKPENYCAFYASGAKGNIVMALVLPFFANFSVVHGCPYLVGRHELLDYEFDARMIPTLLPSASYRVDVRFSNEFNETIYYTETFSQVRNFKLY
jgi:Protein of unknown function (DUF1091)